MAFVTTRPDIATTMPDISSAGIKLLTSLTANRIWADASLQYYFGDNTALTLDSEFKSFFQSMIGGGTPDAVFKFETMTENAFRAIDAVTALDFSRTDDVREADQVIVSVSKPKSSTEGFFQFPGYMYHDGSNQTDGWSLGVFNSGLGYMRQAAELGGGEYGNWTVLHEIGHSLGLMHTHQEKGNLPPLATVGKFMDNEMYSVMSYNPASGGTNNGHAVSMMALDVASLQALYGTETYADGDSSYTLLNAKGGALDLGEGSVAIGRAYYCIWDSGGDDIIQYGKEGNGNQSVLINLNDATLDTSGISSDLKSMIAQLKASDFYQDLSSLLQQEIVDRWHHAGGFFSHVLTKAGADYKAIAGGFSIAHDAVIENATGGNASDLIIGNEVDNLLHGSGGNDTMLGAGGSDTLFGEAGADRLDGGFGSDTLLGGAGNDRFVFSDGYGVDAIADFSDGDIIDLTRLGLGVFSDYQDLRDNHISDDVNGRARITVGTDILIIVGVTKAELSAADFAI